MVEDDGVGAVVLDVPPVPKLYHSKLLPVAVNGSVVEPTQYVIGVVTVGGAGNGVMFTVIGVLGLSPQLSF